MEVPEKTRGTSREKSNQNIDIDFAKIKKNNKVDIFKTFIKSTAQRNDKAASVRAPHRTTNRRHTRCVSSPSSLSFSFSHFLLVHPSRVRSRIGDQSHVGTGTGHRLLHMFICLRLTVTIMHAVC